MQSASQQLIQTLKTYPLYQNLNEYYIRKDIGKKHNIKRATNKHLMKEIELLNGNEINNEVELPEEMWEHILLESNELTNLCFTSKKTVEICQNKSFWRKKCVMNNLPFEWIDQDHHIKEWITLYNKLLYSKQYSEKLIDLSKHLHLKYPDNPVTFFYFNDSSKDMDKVLPVTPKQLQKFEEVKERQENPDDCQFVLYIRLNEGENNDCQRRIFDAWIVSYYLEDDQGDEVVDLFEMINNEFFHPSVDQVQDILMKWLFYIYDEEHDLVDDSGFYYVKEPLENLMQLNFNAKSYNQPQYKKLKTRLDFLSQ